MEKYKAIISGQLQQLQMLMHRTMFSQRGRKFNPQRGQGRILAILKLKPTISQKELTYILNMSKQAVAELIIKLEKSHFIVREPAQEDRRMMMIRLTEEGQKAAERVEHDASDYEEILGCLNEDELAHFSEYLSRIIKQFEEKFPNEHFDKRRAYMEKFMSSQRPGLDEMKSFNNGLGGFGRRGRHHRHGRDRDLSLFDGGDFSSSKEETDSPEDEK